MDATTPLVPDLDGFRAKVLEPNPRTTGFVCCVCHGNALGLRRGAHHICKNPACWEEANALGWVIV